MKLPRTEAELKALIKQETDIAWIQGFQAGYSESLLDTLEAQIGQPEKPSKQIPVRVN
jgi:hypothetical protein